MSSSRTKVKTWLVEYKMFGLIIRLSLFSVKAETHDATNRCDTSPRQVAATNRLVWHVQIIVSGTEFCRCDLSHEFKLVWIRATNRSDKTSASSLVATCVCICDKSLRQNLNQLMREHQLVSRHIKFELVYISSLPKSIAYTEQMPYRSDLSQHQCRREDLSPLCVAAICRIACLGLWRALVSHTFVLVYMREFGYYILFGACRDEGNHSQTTKDNQTYTQEHNLP